MMTDKELLLSLFSHMEREHVVSIPQAAKLYGVTSERVHDALEVLVFCYDSVDIRLDVRENFACLECARSSKGLRLTRRESDVLLEALNAQGYPADAELSAKLLAAKGPIAADAPDPRPRIASIPDAPAPETLAALAAACEDPAHHLVRLSYRAAPDADAGWRIVEPYLVTADGPWRYLQAFCLKAQGWRSFRLERIEALERLETTFEPRADALQTHGAAQGTAQLARIALQPGTEPPGWPGLAALGANEDGELVVSVPWYGTQWLARRVAGMFGAARVIDPPELARAVRDYAEQLLGQAPR